MTPRHAEAWRPPEGIAADRKNPRHAEAWHPPEGGLKTITVFNWISYGFKAPFRGRAPAERETGIIKSINMLKNPSKKSGL